MCTRCEKYKEQILPVMKRNGLVVEDNGDRVVIIFFFDTAHDEKSHPLTVVYRPEFIHVGTFVFTENHCNWVTSPLINFFILNGTLAAKPKQQNDEVPLYLSDLPLQIQQDIIYSICGKAFAFGVVQQFLARYALEFLGRPVYPSGRIGYFVRQGLEECHIAHPEFCTQEH